MSSLFLKTLFFRFFFFSFLTKLAASNDFTFNGFSSANLSLDGVASIKSNGLLELTNSTENVKGHAFYPMPLRFKSAAGKILSFSTTFVFAILAEATYLGGEGIIFLVSRTTDFSAALPNQYLGLLNPNTNGNSTNHILAVELDTIQNPEFQDISDNHVGVDINSLKSSKSYTAGYYEDTVVRRTTTSLRNSPSRRRHDAAGDVTNTTRIENNREKQSTQYLTRFGNVPTSSGQRRERSF